MNSKETVESISSMLVALEGKSSHFRIATLLCVTQPTVSRWATMVHSPNNTSSERLELLHNLLVEVLNGNSKAKEIYQQFGKKQRMKWLSMGRDGLLAVAGLEWIVKPGVLTKHHGRSNS
ncbi:MAG: hypothetical protein NUW37_18020 [Planctomycetes bacterium]|nr:hypothetical protein [Planctomycetota bacterium]